MIINFR